MFNVIKERLKQRNRTVAYPKQAPVLPDRFRGMPELNPTATQSDCYACAKVCPTDCISISGKKLTLDLGKCIFCGACETASTPGAIRFTKDYRLAAGTRDGLLLNPDRPFQNAAAMKKEMLHIFGRSLRLRQVSAGGCNACEADCNVLGTLGFDLGRFGIQFVASPRHADGILVTGPVPENMRLALRKTYEAIPSPKLVIAVGACAIHGGPYVGHAEAQGGAEKALEGIPVDLFVPGCPPHPCTILDGLLRLLGRREER